MGLFLVGHFFLRAELRCFLACTPISFESMKPKHKKKTTLIFDEQQRRSFLTGFHKRKLERKRVGKEKLIEDIKAEKREIQKEKRNAVTAKLKKYGFDSLISEG